VHSKEKKVKLRGHRAAAAYSGLSERAWFDRLKRFDYSWCEVGSHGTYPGSATIWDTKSLDHRNSLVGQEKRENKKRAAQARWDPSSGSTV
jgi:hypothetical protein